MADSQSNLVLTNGVSQ